MVNKKTVTVTMQGVRGGKLRYESAGMAEIASDREVFTVKMDCYEGAGESYKARETTQIKFMFPNGSVVTYNSIKDLYKAITGRNEY